MTATTAKIWCGRRRLMNCADCSPHTKLFRREPIRDYQKLGKTLRVGLMSQRQMHWPKLARRSLTSVKVIGAHAVRRDQDRVRVNMVLSLNSIHDSPRRQCQTVTAGILHCRMILQKPCIFPRNVAGLCQLSSVRTSLGVLPAPGYQLSAACL